ncbi:hypothetical protein CAEBREN_06925 [Caenorhabditis brenneri]|uniref:JmjC domain-containing protein n=1 Tax=Caenorhabditis brenneri TaxID=135651 RepID=G0N654_CAEBE|nr:hypothetical protein CAEBREN_06925 [Caenorhabditis brenneri]
MSNFHTSIAEGAKNRRRAATKTTSEDQKMGVSTRTATGQKPKAATVSLKHKKTPKPTGTAEAMPVLEAEVEVSNLSPRADTPMPILEAMPRCQTPPPSPKLYSTWEEAKLAQRQSKQQVRGAPTSPAPSRALPVAGSLSESGSSPSLRASTVSQPSRSSRQCSPSTPPSSVSPVPSSPNSAARAPVSSSSTSQSMKTDPLHTFMRSLHGLRAKTFDTAPIKFTKKFAQDEHLLDNKDAVKVNIWKNGHDFMKSVKEFDEIHLIRSKNGLGMVVPEDLDFDTVTKFIIHCTKNLFSIINSRTQDSTYMDIPQLLEQFKNKGKRPEIWNMLSMEFDQENQELKKSFSVPEFIRRNSIIEKLKKVIEKKIQRLNDDIKASGSSQLEAQKKRLEHQLASMPKYQKFLLLSMGDSFTDVHIDFSGTSVYYHVKKVTGCNSVWLKKRIFSGKENILRCPSHQRKSGGLQEN